MTHTHTHTHTYNPVHTHTHTQQEAAQQGTHTEEAAEQQESSRVSRHGEKCSIDIVSVTLTQQGDWRSFPEKWHVSLDVDTAAAAATQQVVQYYSRETKTVSIVSP